jgi:hypothetical protein
MTYRVKDWTKFQHFKDRRPPWIKLYRDILDNRDIAMISDRCFRVLVGCWLLASEDKTREGLLPCAEDIAFRLRIEKTSVIECLDALCDFLYQDDINQASPCLQVGPSETETESEREREGSTRALRTNVDQGERVEHWREPDPLDVFKESKPQLNGKPDPFAINVDPDNEATASMSGLTKELADAIHETWPDYPHFVTTASTLRNDAEKIPGRWRPLLGRVAKRFDPPYVHMGRDQLKKMLINWFEGEVSGEFKRSGEKGKGGIPHQAEASKPSLAARTKRLDDAIARKEQIDPIGMVDTWNEARLDDYGVTPPSMNSLVMELAKAGRVQLGPRRKIVDHNLPDKSMTPKELLKGPQLADPDFVKGQLKGLKIPGRRKSKKGSK